MPDAIMKPIYLRGLLWLYLLGCFLFVAALEPGFLDFDNLPDTNFSCVGKVIGGYYADLETNCQMFHVCTIGQLDEPMDIRFLCLNGTVFDQETRVCERIDEVDCSKSEQFYSLNLELYGNTQPSVLEESETEPPIIIKASTTTTTTTPRPKPKTTRTYYTTSAPTVTTVTKVISSHHFPINGQTDIRFNPEEINISLNPGAPPNIRKPVTYHQQVFSDNKKVVVTTHTTFGTDKEDILRVVPNTQRPVSSTQKAKPPATPADINYGFTYHQTEKVPHNYQYHHANFHQHGQFRDQFKTTERATTRKHPYKEPTTFRTTYVKPQYQYRTEKPQRVQLPVPLLPTLPPLTFSSPAPFSLGHHIEAKRYTNDHQSPRIIISASASVSDASGRRLNYSLGTIGVTPLLEQPPKTYDEYKDHDVVLDPFYHDVPKIKNKRRKRQVNHSEVIKNEQEAVDVLKFLFDWYQNHQRTSTIRVPIDAEDITEINQELAPIVEPPEPINHTKIEPNFGESDLFQRKSKFNIVGDVLSVTEVEDNSTTSTSTSASVGSEDYVDDNYEAVQGTKVETTTISTTSTTRRVRGRGRAHYRKVSESEPKYSASYSRRRGRGRSTTTTEVPPKEEIVEELKKEASLKEESRVVEVSEKSVEETTTKPEETLETTTIGKNSSEETTTRTDETLETTTIKNNSTEDVTKSEEILEITTRTAETTTLKEETTNKNDEVDETSSLEDESHLEPETTTVLDEETTEEFQIASETSAADLKEDETKNLDQETTTISLVNDEVKNSKEETQILSETSAVTEETKTVDELQLLSEDQNEETVEAQSEDFDDLDDLEEKSNVTTPSQVSEGPVTEATLVTTTGEVFDEKTTENETTETITEVTTLEEKESEEIVLSKPKTEDAVSPKIETKNETAEVVLPENPETTEYLHESEETTFATTDAVATETEFSPTSTSSSTTENHATVTTSTSTESPNLTPAQTTTETLDIPRGRSAHRRVRPSRPRSYRRPNPRHRFSTELFTSRPTRRKTTVEINSNALTSQLTTTELVSTSPTEEVPPTDAPLFKSANPTQAESAKESLHTTPLSMTYKLSVRKEKLKSYIFNCFGKAINKFYSDPRDCRLFHYCTSGYTKNQLLDMKFVCDLGTYFDDEKLICTKEKPHRCL
ncbi:uncharacterized protein LOC100142573 isoform X1 [Tribolium castaneum]|uniref:Chitin-binding type-2 domain-containing protein n=1 Tax=Tribolium castaneum TaxID=7070 RepID=D6X0A4_TRICA|nr:PREDICTED: uncharacterized protein LOC100142573 isoform X1 [Tribolium castaneum]EFA09604.2 hypothetical protein TcasGA2_TC011724 [Tribolium castaneum]|eukprot:XP_008198368.1 PREDICTED: uncharacterized protein LOC100142573 isoform X1 [Tribolium castaneum]